METLRSDLKKILLGSADLLNRAGSLQAPSWKFPEKLAISLDVEGALKADKADSSHLLVLELIIDRYCTDCVSVTALLFFWGDFPDFCWCCNVVL